MLFLAEDQGHNLLRDFLAISTWQSLVSITLFISLQVGLWFFLKKYKFAFMYRVILGMGIGLLFGIILQSIIGFPNSDSFEEISKPWNELYWIYELNIWASFFKNIFINGVYLLTVPIVFIAIFKITSKPGETGLGRITAKGIALLLFNVAVMFTVTFFIGILLKVGQGFNLASDNSVSGRDNVPLPQIIWEYIPNNIVGTLAKNSIIPVMVVGALAGGSVKILSKRKQVEMEAIRKAMNTGWDVMMSILMTFMKIMPLAVMSMITVSITSRPIGSLVTIGKVIGVGYLGVVIALGLLTLEVFLSGVKIGAWWKKAWRPLVQGFSTQSSNASLPIAMETLTEDMKINGKAANTIQPISTTMGLIACAGVQSGLATSILWTGDTAGVVQGMGLFTFFIIALFVTVVASLGIAGVPGTATVVTVGVLGGMGFGGFAGSVLAVIAPLDGLFDMGRTGANVVGGVATATIVAKSEGLIEEDSDLLNEKGLQTQRRILAKHKAKDDYIQSINSIRSIASKELKNKELSSDNKNKISIKLKEDIKEQQEKYKLAIKSLKEEKNKSKEAKK
ncbi:dicarboxylate/amino acid:cation symporter [Spiroplasma floricola]|uniref:L-cystine uptake protein TcyP n=1 Tax=Spiroplasma floricola 23-6 TaxID=1336749 RepID=A0A2K8SD70_9MOLU|nr:dicarboxylate/amino acid:cation symporter [Spiroplasma floricola]AUB31396.1 proton/glutamate symporter [Spiroplasma floricola 23-6]